MLKKRESQEYYILILECTLQVKSPWASEDFHTHTLVTL